MEFDHEGFKNVCADVSNGAIAVAALSIGGYFLCNLVIKPISDAIKERKERKRLEKRLKELDQANDILDFEILPDQKTEEP